MDIKDASVRILLSKVMRALAQTRLKVKKDSEKGYWRKETTGCELLRALPYMFSWRLHNCRIYSTSRSHFTRIIFLCASGHSTSKRCASERIWCKSCCSCKEPFCKFSGYVCVLIKASLKLEQWVVYKVVISRWYTLNVPGGRLVPFWVVVVFHVILIKHGKCSDVN